VHKKFTVLRLKVIMLVLGLLTVGCGTSPDSATAGQSGSGVFKAEFHQERARISLLDVPQAPGAPAVTDEQSKLWRRLEADLPLPTASSTGSVQARTGSTSWRRFPVNYSLTPAVAPVQLPTVGLGDPMAAYVTDVAVAATRTFTVPSAVGIYLYRWHWTNGRGSTLTFVFKYEVLADGATARFSRSTNDGPFVLFYEGTRLSLVQLDLGLLLAAGTEGQQGDEFLERFSIGTWIVDETFPGAADPEEVGRFDLRMLSVKNLRFELLDEAADPPNNSTLAADIVGLPITTELFSSWQPDSADWRLTIINATASQPEALRVFSGSSNVTAPDEQGRIAEITQPWDGRDASSQLLPEGRYALLAQGLSALAGGGNSLTRGKIAELVPPVLEVFDAEEQEPVLVASSEASFPDLEVPGPGQVPSPVTLLPNGKIMNRQTGISARTAGGDFSLNQPNDKFIQKIPGLRRRVRLVVTNVPDAENVDNITINVRTTQSGDGTTREIVLLKNLNPENNQISFRRDIFLGEPPAGNNEPHFPITAVSDSFSSLDGTCSNGGTADSRRFIGVQQSLSRVQLGDSFHWPLGGKAFRMQTPPSVEALRAAGYESLVAEYAGRICWVRVKNQASRYYISGHGWHDANRLAFNDPKFSVHPTTNPDDPNGLHELDWKQHANLQEITFAACSLLDVGNWNQGYHGHYFDVPSPGLQWEALARHGTLWLGYNSSAPDAESDESVVYKRDARIYDLYVEQRSRGDHPTLAWLRANARMETRLGDNASAIFGDYYYFIKYEGDDSVHRDREIWKVHRDYWPGTSAFHDIPEAERGRIWIQGLGTQKEGEDHGAF